MSRNSCIKEADSF